MLQTLIQRYENGCLMLMEQKDTEFHFLGTAFIIHEQGYLLTAAHLLNEVQRPVVVNAAQPGVFSELSTETQGSLPVRIAQIDRERDLALLQLEIDAEFGSPADFIGNPEDVEEGTFALSIGIPFGHLRIHNVMVMNSMISAKLLSSNQTKLFLFDGPVHPGDVGGPLINSEDGRIVGLVQGIFNPLQIMQQDAPDEYQIPSRFSYAVSIEYAKPIMETAGLN